MPVFGLLAVLGVMIAANLVNASNGGIAALWQIGNRSETWIITLLLLGGQLALAGWAIKGRWDGVFIDEHRKISLSRFQLILWTAVLVSALISAGLSNAANGQVEPLKIDIPPTVWSLLGIGSFSFVAASLLKRQQFERGLITPNPSGPSWLDLIRSEDGTTVDVSKLQQLAFTAMLITIYIGGLYEMMGQGGNAPEKVTTFPGVDDGFIALLGLSHAAYLIKKQVILWK